MKTSLVAIALTAALVVPVTSFAQSSEGLSRAQVRNEMIQVEQAGYNPAHMNPRTFTSDIQAAQARVAQANTAYGASTDGSSQAGVAK
ncbi:DUF4148 domain-containing protein [Paraburkholderia sp. J12]|uniref:DUF4148 domain-containing protein n=1 Tax=Paraburkholderia sp. J12 TaxID=2805432 RepID=UPI002ABD44F0|nr:DUF4148 domain-containing protein [Paraburkholderia sp. J12]